MYVTIVDKFRFNSPYQFRHLCTNPNLLPELFLGKKVASSIPREEKLLFAPPYRRFSI